MNRLKLPQLLQESALLLSGFVMTLLVANKSFVGAEYELAEQIDLVTRQLEACYEHQEGLIPVGGYRASCTLDVDGFFILASDERWLEPGPEGPGVD